MRTTAAMAAAALPCLMLVAGCAGARATYPSLAPRPIEQRGWAEPKGAAPAVAAVDPALDAAVAGKVRALADADRAFTDAAARAERAVAAAKGDPVGGERWLAAQTLLAELDAAREGTLDALSDIQQLALERTQAASTNYPALDAAEKQAEAQLAAESKRIETLQAALPEG